MGDINLICYTDSLPINHSLFARVLGHCETFVSGINKLKLAKKETVSPEELFAGQSEELGQLNTCS